MAEQTLSGRAASIARRLALSAGRAALPAAAERTRHGKRDAVLPTAAAPAIAASAPPPPAPAPVSAAASSASGRALSMERRRQLSAGKTAVQPGVALTMHAAPAPVAVAQQSGSAHDIARARRALLAQSGRGATPAAGPSRPPREGVLAYPAKVAVEATQGGLPITGIRIGQGRAMTGDERGQSKPVSGTQYLGADTGAAFRAQAPKVGVQVTAAGQHVTGTLVRSAVRITGDEAVGAAVTGEVDQHPGHDRTARRDSFAAAGAQFARQADPHGATVFGTNLGRSLTTAGSRDRTRGQALEQTDKGLAITGSAVGRSVRVTGDESGACRTLTGTQYLAPARRNAACTTGVAVGGERADAVTVAKVTVAQSWGGQRVTGPHLEHHGRVTGDEPGSCGPITGSQYQGPATAHGWCPPDAAGQLAHGMARRRGNACVTGNTPLHSGGVTGTARGAARAITGTVYYAPENSAAPPDVAAIDERFSIRTPQRSSQLAAEPKRAEAPGAARITGAFAVGTGRVTGNLEFQMRPRAPANDAKPAHTLLTGEGGATLAKSITGDSWEANPRVTGQEAAFAADRNPSERGPKAKPFAGSSRFKALAVHEEPKQLVTGMMGYFSKTGARVTLSGGAQS